jgi:hypothetical protein
MCKRCLVCEPWGPRLRLPHASGAQLRNRDSETNNRQFHWLDKARRRRAGRQRRCAGPLRTRPQRCRAPGLPGLVRRAGQIALGACRGNPPIAWRAGLGERLEDRRGHIRFAAKPPRDGAWAGATGNVGRDEFDFVRANRNTTNDGKTHGQAGVVVQVVGGYEVARLGRRELNTDTMSEKGATQGCTHEQGLRMQKGRCVHDLAPKLDSRAPEPGP